MNEKTDNEYQGWVPKAALDLMIPKEEVTQWFDGAIPAVGERMTWVVTEARFEGSDLIFKAKFKRLP